MRLHNTLTRRIEDLEPRDPTGHIVTLYTCGPTVYNYQHIGNMRASLVNDFLRRALEASGYIVRHVMNITDVGHLTSDADEGEDKLEKGAAREGKTVWEVADHYTEAFKADRQRLNILEPNVYTDPQRHDHYARATDFIPQQIAMVKVLLEKGFAYQTSRPSTSTSPNCPIMAPSPAKNSPTKKWAPATKSTPMPTNTTPSDFAVWFFTVGRYADHTMHWPSPWGKGFPGWHLECSAIIHETLGDPIDIHTGGIEHIGTHPPPMKWPKPKPPLATL